MMLMTRRLTMPVAAWREHKQPDTAAADPGREAAAH